MYQKERVDELLKCVNVNIKYDIFTKYILFLERTKDDNKFYNKLKNFNIKWDKKIEIIEITYRPIVKNMIEYVENKYPNEICFLSNSDILFHKTIKLVKNINFEKCHVALTRYNILPHYGPVYGYKGILKKFGNKIIKSMHANGRSTDTWIFKLPLNIKNELDFPLGTIYCDSFFNGLLQLDKPTFNPVSDIISIHLHKYWNTLNYKNKYHSSNVHFKKKYKNYQSKIKFCKLKDCILHV